MWRRRGAWGGAGLVLCYCRVRGRGIVAPVGRRGSPNGLCIKGILDCNEVKRYKKCVMLVGPLLRMVI